MEKRIQEQMQRYERLYKEQDDFYRRAAQWAGLSDAAYWVLYRLCGEDKEITQSEMCKDWYFSKQTINSAVTKLVSAGYIELISSNGKGNRKRISLTTDGEKFCEKYVIPVLEAERSSFEQLTDEERERMIELMKKQLDILNREAEKLWQ